MCSYGKVLHVHKKNKKNDLGLQYSNAYLAHCRHKFLLLPVTFIKPEHTLGLFYYRGVPYEPAMIGVLRKHTRSSHCPFASPRRDYNK